MESKENLQPQISSRTVDIECMTSKVKFSLYLLANHQGMKNIFETLFSKSFIGDFSQSEIYKEKNVYDMIHYRVKEMESLNNCLRSEMTQVKLAEFKMPPQENFAIQSSQQKLQEPGFDESSFILKKMDIAYEQIRQLFLNNQWEEADNKFKIFEEELDIARNENISRNNTLKEIEEKSGLLKKAFYQDGFLNCHHNVLERINIQNTDILEIYKNVMNQSCYVNGNKYVDHVSGIYLLFLMNSDHDLLLKSYAAMQIKKANIFIHISNLLKTQQVYVSYFKQQETLLGDHPLMVDYLENSFRKVLTDNFKIKSDEIKNKIVFEILNQFKFYSEKVGE